MRLVGHNNMKLCAACVQVLPRESFSKKQWQLKQYERRCKECIAADREVKRQDPLLNWTRPTREECPICMVPLPLGGADYVYRSCCGKTICMGCLYDQIEMDKKEGRCTLDTMKAHICPFCRSEKIDNVHDLDIKLAKAGNLEAMWQVGKSYFDGDTGVQQDKNEGVKWYRRAAEAGSPRGTFSLGRCYEEGDGVEQNLDRALEYCQKAAELGNIDAFVAVGRLCIQKGEMDEAVLNLRKAVICGLSDIDQFNGLRACYRGEYITKEEYAFTLRENQKATDEMKSESREKVKKLSLML